MDNYITSLSVLINRSVTMVILLTLALVINTQYNVIMYNYSLIITYWTKRSIDGYVLINDWSMILLCLPCIIFHEYMCRFLLFTEFWCFTTRFSSCYEIWLSHRQNNIFLINDWSSILLCLPCIIFHKYADFSCLL